MPTKAKRPEIFLATGPNRAGIEFFGDRDFGDIGGCGSLWLSLRVVDDGSLAAYQLRSTMCDIGLWVWFSKDRDSICCEFRAHEVHSASIVELGRVIKELRRLNNRVPQRVHGQSYPDYVMSTLRAAGLERCVEYRGIGVKDEYVGLTSVRTKLTDEFNRRLPRAAA